MKTDLWECRTTEGLVVQPVSREYSDVKPIDPLWIIFWVAIVFTLGALGVGLTQWWRNRKAKRAAEKVMKSPSKSWQELLDSHFPKFDFDKVQLGVTPKGDIAVAESIDKNPDSLQDEIKEIYSLIQLARNDINKITGFMQLCVTPAMENLNKARDRVAALGGKVK